MAQSNTPSMIPGLLSMKCPQCRSGKVFKDSNPYHLKNMGEMHPLCPVCGLNFRPEPGFYFGGAIISYPIMVIYNLLVAVAFYLIVGDIFNHVFTVLLTMTIATVIISPVIFRYSRIIFLYAVVRFNKAASAIRRSKEQM